MNNLVIERPMTQSGYREMSLQELYTRLASHVQAGETALIEGSKILAELKRRGETHEFMRRGLFKWFEQIDAGTLDASAVIKFAGDDQIISRLVRLPISQQAMIAKTGNVIVAEQAKTGEIIETEKSIIRMDLKQLDRVFGDKGIRTIAQQTKLLKAASAPTPKPAAPELVRADARDGVLVIAGRHHIEPNALIEPLRRLGYKIVKAN